jgi:hypothetical protein
MSEEAEIVEQVNPEIKDEVKTELSEEEQLEKDFAKFKTSMSIHEVEEEEEEEDPQNFIPDEHKIDAADDFRVSMFLGFAFSLIDGIHVFAYQKISGTDLTEEELSLDPEQQDVIISYFKTKRVVAIMNSIPNEFWGLLHMEWMYFKRYKAAMKLRKEQEEKGNKLTEQKLIELSKKRKKRLRKPPIKKDSVKKPPVKRPSKKKPKKEIKT